MTKEKAIRLLDAATGRKVCDLVIRNAKVVNVYTHEIQKGDLFVDNGLIVGIGGNRKANKEIDAKGAYLVPGFIDGHCHIESSHLTPTAFSDIVVPYGTTSVIADPHEICNVCGNDAMAYMLKSARNATLSIYYMYPSCVPATPFEHAGCILGAKEAEEFIDNDSVLGLGEMMNYPGVVNADEMVLDKLAVAYEKKKNIDGHAPNVSFSDLDGYIGVGITTDHECATAEELKERIARGMYVMLRQGTACKNVLDLVKGIDDKNYRWALFCTDDRQPETIVKHGHLNHGVNLAIGAGLDPVSAICMATINAAECYGLKDRGAIAPGKRADFFLTEKLTDIKANQVFIDGKLVAENGNILKPSTPVKAEGIEGRMNVKDFSAEKLKLKLKSDHVRIIDIIPGQVVTKAGEAYVKRDENGCWVHDSSKDILKLAVVERHNGLGNVAVALIRGYGMKHGAVATSIAHDSHNIIVIGDNDEDMAAAVENLISLGGGITMVKDGKVIDNHPLEVGGLMTGDSAMEVSKTLDRMHETAYKELGVSKDVDPFMTLCFMALPVIPEYKLTDIGLFDVVKFDFVDINLD